jgi:ubiquinone/menaquinone biosynthesis C-methylase UbiE
MKNATHIRENLKHYYNHSERYIAEMQSHDDAYFGTHLDWVAANLLRLVGPKGRLLELGCGGGSSTKAFADRLSGYHCTGLDISEPAIALAASRYRAANLEYRSGDCLELPWPDASLDAVISRDMIEHIPDVGRALREMDRVLKPGGVIIIRSPHHRSPLFALVDLLRLRANYPFTTSWLGNIPRLVELSADFVRKLFAREPRFHYRTPDLSDTVVVGLDADAVYEVSSLDLTTFFRNRGYTVHNVGATYGRSAASQLVPRLLPYLASIGLVVQKPASAG